MTTGAGSEASERGVRARSFGQAAASYVAGRPGYPIEAVSWMLQDDVHTVADVGAGTGKLTAAIVATGRTAIAIDPDADMLTMLREQVPGVQTHVGRAEHIPLADASVDAVTLGQAWHWVDPERSSTEIARVLRPGGTLGLIWNIRDESVPWVAAIGAAMHTSDAEQMIADGGPTVFAPFGALEHAEFRWSNPVTLQSLLAMVASRSYLITADQTTRERILGDVRALIEADPETADRDEFDLPYVTHAFRARVR